MTDKMRNEVDFLLYNWLNVERLKELPAFADQDREDWDAYLDLSSSISREQFLECYKVSDREEPYLDNGQVRVQKDLKNALTTYIESGLHLATLTPEHGGMGFPFSVASGAMSEFMASNVAGSGFIMLSVANTRVITEFGTPEQIEAFAMPQIEGASLGTMCLSEPDIGSSLGDVTTKAVPDGSDSYGTRYRVSGRKMWISAGDQDVTDNVIHLVLAKVVQEDSTTVAGPKGTSLFIVPKILPADVMDGAVNDVAVAGLNHKMGYRGTPNCLLNFGEGDGAIGWMIGEEGDGLRIMFQMMNEARTSVGLSGAAMAYRGFELAQVYCAERVQGRPVHEKSRKDPTPIMQHPDVRRMLLTQKVISEGALALCLKSAFLCDLAQYSESEGEHASALLGLLTPVIKSWPSEQGLVSLHNAIQVHGGYGYTRDFDVEQLYRDSRLNPIHEGTTGIQAIDLMGRKILMDKGASFKYFIAEVKEVAATAGDSFSKEASDLLELCDLFSALVDSIINSESPDDALSNATCFLEAFGHFVIGWIWLDLAVSSAKTATPEIAEEKKWACRYFFAAEMPKIQGMLAMQYANGDLTRAVPDSIFAQEL